MNQTIFENYPIFVVIFLILIVWSMIWKGLALWKAARNNHLGWFIALLIINTVGILEIVYILAFSNKKKEGTQI